jgi:cell division septation protein DedD
MASGGKRGAGERVLESKHVIGLFLLMLLFSGVFFTLGYVMGRNQYDMQVRAASNAANHAEAVYMPKIDPAPPKKITGGAAPSGDSDPATDSSSSVWNYPSTHNPASVDPHLEPAPAPRVVAPVQKQQPAVATAKEKPQPQPVSVRTPAKALKGTLGQPAIPSGAYVIQVAALLNQDDAVTIASGLQKKHYAVYVQTPQKDKYYRVQVGPFKDQKSADSAKKGLEGEGFKAFYVKH